MTDLLPCPFCGGEASLKTRSLDERFGYAEQSDAACKKCGIGYSFQDAQNPNGGYALGGTGAPRAIAAWNTRAPTSAPRDAVIARLVEALENMLEIRAVWTDPHNDTDCAKSRAALAAAKAVQP